MEENQSTTPTNSSSRTVFIILAIAVIIALIAWAIKNKQPADTTQSPDTNTQSQNPPAVVTKKYEDGTYTATGNYVSPAGTEEVVITLVLKDDVVTSATFEGKAVHPTSKFVQGKFSEGFTQAVVGKNIEELNLTVVNGSSLTPKGFMDALAKIKVDAQT
jgi:uncharacterized protein with FMN-binding domain